MTPDFKEAVLSILPGERDTERVIVVLRLGDSLPEREFGTTLELRRQSYAEGIGWFTQSSVPLNPSQVAGLRQALGSNEAPRPTTRSERARSLGLSSAWTPNVIRADSA